MSLQVTARTNGDDTPDGDAVRRVIGTVGVGSPLFGIERVLKTIGRDLDERELLDDPVEYTETVEVRLVPKRSAARTRTRVLQGTVCDVTCCASNSKWLAGLQHCVL